MNDKLRQAYLLEGLREARDVMDARISEVEEGLGINIDDDEGGDGPPDPLIANAAIARKALAEQREEFRRLGGQGIFSKSKLEALRRRSQKARSAGGA